MPKPIDPRGPRFNQAVLTVALLGAFLLDAKVVVPAFAVVLFLFLFNVRTTAITLMAMPLSFAVAVLVFRWFGVSVNSMTLGGLAVAIGMVVDDAIVDVENVADMPVALVVELSSDIQRLPDDSRSRLILGIDVPLVSVDAMIASAPA